MKSLAVFIMFIVYALLFGVIADISNEKKQKEIVEQTKKRYKDIHRLATDAEIKAYEYIFEIPCDSTCYH